ncbi:MAG: endonuclease V [Firmicutes bacterium]|nr:endonuclease V [Bacillota bacterium]
MLLALDVYYRKTYAVAVGVIFDWFDDKSQKIIIEYIDEVDEYIPGEFYKRELPCIMRVIKQVNIGELEAIIVDGHIYVEKDTYGLGGKLYEQLNQQLPIVGVAKNSFLKNKDTVKEIYRGVSKKPLYVSTVGIDSNTICEKIAKMKGNYRIPILLKELDSITKQSIIEN